MNLPTPAKILLSKYQLNSKLTLSNRIIMAPVTRCLALKDLVPNPVMADYYARRSEAGLIISEATIICKNAQGYPNTPGIFTKAQVDGWQRITDAVHQKAGKIFCQLWHVGRASHPMYLQGKPPVAPSAIPLLGKLALSNMDYGSPVALKTSEIANYVEYFANAAYLAIQAGFDGVEIHGANGYLIDQFLHHHTNARYDRYGKTPQGKSRFLLDIIDAIADVIGRELIGVRLSPGAFTLGIEPHIDDHATFKYLLEQIEKRHIAYLHTAIDADQATHFEHFGGIVSEFTRQHYHGHLIANGSYTPETASQAIADNQFNLVAFARLFLANPDLIEKIKYGKLLSDYTPDLLEAIN